MSDCPFTGKPCNNPKTIHVDGNYVCQICATTNPHGLITSLFDLLNSFLQVVTKKPCRQCPKCGTTIDDIASKSRLGCPYCYEFYKNELIPALTTIHKSAEHKGKQPKFRDNLSVEQLKLQLKQAIEKENYEQAKIINDKLKQVLNSDHV